MGYIQRYILMLGIGASLIVAAFLSISLADRRNSKPDPFRGPAYNLPDIQEPAR